VLLLVNGGRCSVVVFVWLKKVLWLVCWVSRIVIFELFRWW